MRAGTDNYIPKQMARDAQHAQNYRAWVASLPAAEQARLKAKGLDEPDIGYHGTGMSDRDLADSPLASEEPDMAAMIDHIQARAEEPEHSGSGDALASFCARLCGSGNPRLVFDAICFATGILAIEGCSATDLAAKHGVTKQAFSKIAVQWCQTFGLIPSRSMKSPKARQAYRISAKNRHEKRLTKKDKQHATTT